MLRIFCMSRCQRGGGGFRAAERQSVTQPRHAKGKSMAIQICSPSSTLSDDVESGWSDGESESLVQEGAVSSEWQLLS